MRSHIGRPAIPPELHDFSGVSHIRQGKIASKLDVTYSSHNLVYVKTCNQTNCSPREAPRGFSSKAYILTVAQTCPHETATIRYTSRVKPRGNLVQSTRETRASNSVQTGCECTFNAWISKPNFVVIPV